MTTISSPCFRRSVCYVLLQNLEVNNRNRARGINIEVTDVMVMDVMAIRVIFKTCKVYYACNVLNYCIFREYNYFSQSSQKLVDDRFEMSENLASKHCIKHANEQAKYFVDLQT
jgi:hypothetical protein